MSDPKRHHYLPECYLKFFHSQDSESKVWLYARNKKPEHTNVKNVTVQHHYYSVNTDTGEKDTTFEKQLGKLEGKASEVLKKFNQMNVGDIIQISPQEKRDVLHFVATLVTRTPAYRALGQQQLDIILRQCDEDVRLTIPEKVKIKSTIRKAYDEDFFNVIESLDFAKEIGENMLTRDIHILKSLDANFITGDCLGFRPEEGVFFVPISSKCVLSCVDPAITGYPGHGTQNSVHCDVAVSDFVNSTNQKVMCAAERNIVASSNCADIKNKFDETEKPIRAKNLSDRFYNNLISMAIINAYKRGEVRVRKVYPPL